MSLYGDANYSTGGQGGFERRSEATGGEQLPHFPYLALRLRLKSTEVGRRAADIVADILIVAAEGRALIQHTGKGAGCRARSAVGGILGGGDLDHDGARLAPETAGLAYTGREPNSVIAAAEKSRRCLPDRPYRASAIWANRPRILGPLLGRLQGPAYPRGQNVEEVPCAGRVRGQAAPGRLLAGCGGARATRPEDRGEGKHPSTNEYAASIHRHYPPFDVGGA